MTRKPPITNRVRQLRERHGAMTQAELEISARNGSVAVAQHCNVIAYRQGEQSTSQALGHAR